MKRFAALGLATALVLASGVAFTRYNEDRATEYEPDGVSCEDEVDLYREDIKKCLEDAGTLEDAKSCADT